MEYFMASSHTLSGRGEGVFFVLIWRKGTDKWHRRGCMREYVGLMTHLMDATHGRWEGCRHGNVATRRLLLFRRLQHHMNNPDSLISLLCWDDGDLDRVKYMDCALISFFFCIELLLLSPAAHDSVVKGAQLFFLSACLSDLVVCTCLCLCCSYETDAKQT